MSYASMIRRNLRTAFTLLGDLKETVVFGVRSSEEFDFEDNGHVRTENQVSAEIVVVRTKKKSAHSNTTAKTILVKAEGLESLSSYDIVTMDGLEWTVGPPLLSDGYIHMLEIFSEN
jgi:hypothetical protein